MATSSVFEHTGAMPDGSYGTCCLLSGFSGNSYRISGNPISPGKFVFSVWIKANSSNAQIGFSILGQIVEPFVAGVSWQRAVYSIEATGGTEYIDIMPQTDSDIYLWHAKLETGDKPSDWTPSPDEPSKHLKASGIEITDEHIELTSGVISARVIGESGDAQELLNISQNGVVATKFSLADGGLKETIPGGYFTVGEGGDYETLADVFSSADGGVEGKTLMGDLVLKLLDPYDDGCEIRGVSGPGRVIIAPVNLIPTNPNQLWTGTGSNRLINGSGATIDISGASTIVTLTEQNSYRTARIRLGLAGPMGIAGKTLIFSGKAQGSSSTSLGGVRLYVGDQDISGVKPNSSSSALQVLNGMYHVPKDVGWFDIVELMLYASRSEAAQVGSYVTYTDMRLEYGNEMQGGDSYSDRCIVSGLSVDGCSAEVILYDIAVLGAPIKVRRSSITLNRVGLFNQNGSGVMLWESNAIMAHTCGSCVDAVQAFASNCHIHRTYPAGTMSPVCDMSESGVIHSPTAPLPRNQHVIDIYATSTGSRVGGQWTGASLRQGFTGGDKNVGFALFDMSAIPSGAAVQNVKLRLRRIAGYGTSGAVNASVKGITASELTGNPTRYGGTITKSFKQDDIKKIDITSLYLENPGFTGIALENSDSQVSARKTSSGYSRFTGTGGGDDTRPMLTVTYTL